MLSMTDYLIQEQTTEDELVDESVVLEAFAAMQASYSYLEYMDRLMAINEFCVSTDVECPSIIQEGDFGEAVLSFFQNIWDWICGLIRSMTGYFRSISLSRISKALKKSNKSAIKMKDVNFAYSDFGMKMCLTLLDDLCETLNMISGGRLNDSRDEVVKLLQEIIDGEVPSLKRANANNVRIKLNNCPYDLAIPESVYNQTLIARGLIAAQYSPDKSVMVTTDSIISLLDRINELDVPKTGKKILDKIEYKKDSIKKNGEIDKEVQRLIRRAANNIAKLYDKSFGSFVSNLEDVLTENEIKLDEQDKAFLERKGKSKRTGRDQSEPLGRYTKDLRAAIK